MKKLAIVLAKCLEAIPSYDGRLYQISSLSKCFMFKYDVSSNMHIHSFNVENLTSFATLFRFNAFAAVYVVLPSVDAVAAFNL